MQLREIMTAGIATAYQGDEVLEVARPMRDRGVDSVVVCDPEGGPVAMITDRDLAVRVAADDRPLADPVGDYASRPLITGEPDMDLEEGGRADAAPSRPPPAGGRGRAAAGIVTLDDIAVRTGNLEAAKRMTAEVIEGALPDFYFHERG